jgi:hypothetical protein
MRITETQRGQIEGRIRAAIDRMLQPDYVGQGNRDVKTLARESGVSRAAIYSTYAHLKEEFELRRDRLSATENFPDQRDAQIDRLKDSVADLKSKTTRQNDTITELRRTRDLAVVRLAAQHEEILRLRTALNRQRHLHPIRGSSENEPRRQDH